MVIAWNKRFMSQQSSESLTYWRVAAKPMANWPL
jgi:hypothetical protein